jgi:predicted phage terminase large subunit-like protein
VRWFSETLPTRVNDQETTPFVVIMQRVHERDISGFILAKKLGYTHLCLPMEYEPDHPHKSTRFTDPRTQAGDLLWPERFSRESIEEMKRTFRAFGGTYAEAGQLQQRPAPRGGGMFQRKDFKIIDALPAAAVDPVVQRARGWDLASSVDKHAAWSVGVLMARLRSGAIVIEDVRRGQWSSMQLYAEMAAAQKADGPLVLQSVPQDPGQAGKDQKRHMAANLHGADVKFSPETGSKVDRARPFAAQAEAGNVYLIRAEWNDAYFNEICSFPRSEFMDQVDASSRAYTAVVAVREQLIGCAPKVMY